MSKNIDATKGAEQLCQPKCLTVQKIMSVSSWGPHIEWIAFIMANQNSVKATESIWILTAMVTIVWYFQSLRNCGATQWCRGRGASAPPKYWFGGYPWKSGQNLGKSGQILWKPLQNRWKSGQTPWRFVRKWRPTRFGLRKWRPTRFGLRKWRPIRSSWENVRTKSGPKFFQASLEKFGQKPFAHPINLPSPHTLWCHP